MPDEPIIGNIGPEDDAAEELRKAFEEAEKELASKGYRPEPEITLPVDGFPPEGPDPEEESKPPSHPLDPEEEQLRLLDERLRAAASRHHEKSGTIHEEFEGRLSEFDDRYGPSIEKRKAQKEDEKRRAKSEASASKGLGLGLSIAYTIIGLPLVGIGIGWWLDKEFHTNVWKGILATLGACAGVAFTVMMMNRTDEK